jgi:general secretion pathway protein M
MSISNLFAAFLTRFPAGASILYVGVVMAFGITAFTTVAEILQRRDAVATTAAVSSQLESRGPTVPRGRGEEPDARTAGSPLLDGATVTVGGDNLLQRVAGSITRFGGNILYTQVDLEGPQSKDGFVSATVNWELEQPALQQLLYDLESGMPFLFVDQLVAQGPAAAATPPQGKLRLVISVSGQWRGAK